MATKRELLSEIRRYKQAEQLLSLGARVPVVYEMTRLSNWFLRKLSREICGTGPRKGQMPNSEMWYLRARNNLQASLFMAMYNRMKCTAGEGVDSCELLISAYAHYRAAWESLDARPALSLDRAWWLLKSFKIRNLKLIRCIKCHGNYVAHFGDLDKGFVCHCCRAPNGRQHCRKSAERARAPDIPCEAIA
jgi:flagellar transcriptional activator FlhC